MTQDAAPDLDGLSPGPETFESFETELVPLEAKTSTSKLEPFDTTWRFEPSTAPFSYAVQTRTRIKVKSGVSRDTGKVRITFAPGKQEAIVKMDFLKQSSVVYSSSEDMIDEKGIIAPREDRVTNLPNVFPYLFPTTGEQLTLSQATTIPMTIPMNLEGATGKLEGAMSLTPKRVVTFDGKELVEMGATFMLNTLSGDELIKQLKGTVSGKALLYYDVSTRRYHSGQVASSMRMDYVGTPMADTLMKNSGSTVLDVHTFNAYVLEDAE